MFTGLVETVGVVTAVTGSAPCRLAIKSSLPTDAIALGDSVAIDGCCLTVVAKTVDTLSFEAATETMARTTVGQLAVGSKVHLEQALRAGDRLGGHMVAGHVDGVGSVVRRDVRDQALYLGVRAPRDVARLVAPRGSITVAGVSLTVTAIDDTVFEVCLIPHTLQVTHLGSQAVGQRVNLEADLIARYVERLMLVGLTPQDAKDRGQP